MSFCCMSFHFCLMLFRRCHFAKHCSAECHFAAWHFTERFTVKKCLADVILPNVVLLMSFCQTLSCWMSFCCMAFHSTFLTNIVLLNVILSNVVLSMSFCQTLWCWMPFYRMLLCWWHYAKHCSNGSHSTKCCSAHVILMNIVVLNLILTNVAPLT